MHLIRFSRGSLGFAHVHFLMIYNGEGIMGNNKVIKNPLGRGVMCSIERERGITDKGT